jgi:hypothetical protein
VGILIAVMTWTGRATPNRLIALWVFFAFLIFLWFREYSDSIRNAKTVPEILARNGILVVLSIIVSTVLAVALWPKYLDVLPSEVTFSGDNNEDYAFTVINNATHDLYSATIKIKVIERSEPPASIRVQIPKDVKKPIIPGSPLSDTTAVSCRDSNGRMLMMVIIFRLSPNESREYSIREVHGGKMKVTFEPMSFDFDPHPRGIGLTQTFISGKFDEPMTCDGAFFIPSKQ